MLFPLFKVSDFSFFAITDPPSYKEGSPSDKEKSSSSSSDDEGGKKDKERDLPNVPPPNDDDDFDALAARFNNLRRDN